MMQTPRGPQKVTHEQTLLHNARGVSARSTPPLSFQADNAMASSRRMEEEPMQPLSVQGLQPLSQARIIQAPPEIRHHSSAQRTDGNFSNSSQVVFMRQDCLGAVRALHVDDLGSVRAPHVDDASTANRFAAHVSAQNFRKETVGSMPLGPWKEAAVPVPRGPSTLGRAMMGGA